MLGITEYKYLNRDHLEGFDNYKYMAIDTSPLSNYVMHPFWNNVVKIVPRWVAPNVLTFAGFLLTVLDFLLLSYFDYDYLAATSPAKPLESLGEANGSVERIPQVLWYFLAVFLFLAYTLDGIDGKQARRTQTSGPLGELFDHGLDSYSVFFIPACLYSVFGKGDFSIPPIRMYYILWNILFNFYISHWEKYNTGVLFLPWGYDFSMWASTFVFLWTGLHGTGYYKKYMFGTYTLANGFEWVIYGTGVMTNLPVSVYNVYKSYKTGTGKKRSITGALRPLWALLLVFGISSYWVHHSNILAVDSRLVFLLIGTLFSNVACRLIVSQMSNQPCPAGNGLLVPLLLAAMTSLPPLARYDVTALYALTAFVVCAHVHYGSSVVRQMCDHFRIKCFTIKQRTD